MVSAPQCATVLTCVPAPSLGPTFSVPLLVQSTSAATPLLVPGPVLLQGTQAPITMNGPAFPPIPSMPIMLSGVPGAPAPMQSVKTPLQSTTIPPMAIAPWPSQATPYCLMPNYLPRPPAQQSSMQAEREELARQCHDLEVREIEVK